MKRTPLNRKTPLPRGKPLAKRSAKRRAADASEAMDERRDWSSEFHGCFICGGSLMLQTHEIARKSKGDDWRHEANYIRTCGLCHEKHFSWLPIEAQCALKVIHDGERFDISTINRLRNRSEGALTWGDVQKWLYFFQDMRGR